MELQLPPDLEQKLNSLAEQVGQPSSQLVQHAIEAFLLDNLDDGLDDTRATLESRYQDVISGKEKGIPGEEVFARLHQQIDARRSNPA